MTFPTTARSTRHCAFIANEDSRDVEVLKRAALQRMALDYRLQAAEVDAEIARLAAGAIPALDDAAIPGS
jgi:hypothetical protein